MGHRSADRIVREITPRALLRIVNPLTLILEEATHGCTPRLVHARKAKLMLGLINTTDTLDARGLNRLQRAGTLPAVWIPPSTLRDRRDLPRTRMVLVRQRPRLKNRIHAALAKYGVSRSDVSDLFGRQGTRWRQEHLGQLPPQTADAAHYACWSRSRRWTGRW